MHQKPIAKILIGLFLIAVLFTVTQIQAQLADGPSLSAKPDTQVQTAEIPENTVLEEQEEPVEASEEETAVSEEFRDTVSNILESALGFFTKSDLDIVAIGDSLTQGVGDETDNGGYVGILEDTLDEENQSFHIENYGKRGNRTDQLLKRMDDPEIASSLEKADVILVTIGANDIMKVVKNNFANLSYKPFETEQKEYEQRLRQIFETMLDSNPDAEIYLIGFYNPFEDYFKDVDELTRIIDNWNQTSRQVTHDYEQVSYIPVQDLFQAEEERFFAEDNFHPNKLGYRKIAERVFNYIRPSIEKSTEEEETEQIENRQGE